VDSCTGDGGSGLTCEFTSGHYYLAGIVAGGVGCGLKDVPGLYVKVAHYRDWIDEQMRTLSLETLTYEYEQ
jgi:secreted trypsin-like serine protease